MHTFPPNHKTTLYEFVLRGGLHAFGFRPSHSPQASSCFPHGVILCYHSVSDDGWRFSTPVSLFSSQIRFLHSTSSILSLADFLSRDPDLRRGCVSVTFDDGYRSVLTHAFPILKHWGIPATLFAIGDPKRADRRELANDFPLLSIPDLRFLARMGWDIGFHTQTHADLSSLSLPEMREEIHYGKRKMEKQLGIPLRYFAYPKGARDRAIARVVRNAGYDAAFTTDGSRFPGPDPFSLSRISLEGNLPIDCFRGLFTREGSVFHASLSHLMRWKSRIIRSSLHL